MLRITLCLLFLLPFGAFAAESVHEMEAVEVKTDPDDEMVCEYRKRPGSHIKKRICITTAEAKLQAEAAQQYARDAFNNGGRAGQCH